MESVSKSKLHSSHYRMYPWISWEPVADPSDRTIWEPVAYESGSRSDAEHDRSGKGA